MQGRRALGVHVLPIPIRVQARLGRRRLPADDGLRRDGAYRACMSNRLGRRRRWRALAFPPYGRQCPLIGDSCFLNFLMPKQAREPPRGRFCLELRPGADKKKKKKKSASRSGVLWPRPSLRSPPIGDSRFPNSLPNQVREPPRDRFCLELRPGADLGAALRKVRRGDFFLNKFDC